MLSWYPVGDGSCLAGCIGVPLGDIRFVPRVSPETERDQQAVQIGQCSRRNRRGLKLHPDTGGGIQHPRRQDRDDTRLGLDVDDVAVGASLFI